jgi:hypothetical protein
MEATSHVGESEDDDVEALAAEIATYLEAHPDAADSLEGILTWWLARQRYARTRRSVEFALDRLRRRGVVRVDESPTGKIYSSARRRS